MATKIMKKLEGKIAVITGGNSGIGLATAQRFASEGTHVYIVLCSVNKKDYFTCYYGLLFYGCAIYIGSL